MSSKKGFDPLSSLFDLPETAPAPPARPPARGDDLPEPPHVKAPPPAVPPGPDPVQLAKTLARAAAAKAAAARPAAPGPANQAAKTTNPTNPPAGPPSRLMAAPPPRKSLSAADAVRLANEDEARARTAPAPAPTPTAAPAPSAPRSPPAVPVTGTFDPTAVIAGVIQDCLPNVGSVYIAKALVLDDRGVLTALWRAHRARFLSTGDLAGATAVNAVLRAVASVGAGQLAVAHAVTDKSDWLVWVDLSSSSLIAAFKDARAWFAN